MRLFVGGPLHGTQWTPPARIRLVTSEEVPPAQTAGPDNLDNPPPSYVDVATGSSYMAVPVSFALNHPISGEPDRVWESTVYVLVGFAGGPEQAMAALGDAVMRWWFTGHGSFRRLPTGAQNGQAVDAGEWYLVTCATCGIADKTFESMADRAVWAGAHIGQTGHTLSFAKVSAVGPSTTDSVASEMTGKVDTDGS